mgnify:CR=1 FL=1
MPGYLFDEKKFKKKFVNRSEKEIEELRSLIKTIYIKKIKKRCYN